MIEKGKIIVQKSKKGFAGFIEISTKKMPIPSSYEMKDDSLNGKECEVEREKGQIKKIVVDGRILPQKSTGIPHLSSQKRYSSRSEYIQQKTQTSTQQDKWAINNTKLPKDTRDTIQNSTNIDNYSLKLNKAAQFIDDKFSFFKTDKKGNTELIVLPDYSIIPLKDISERQEINIKLLGYEYKKIKNIKINWRLVIGLGDSSIYETSMTLHHIYGIPYIPGSAIKGILRHFLVSELLAKDLSDDNLNVMNKLIETDNIKALFEKGRETIKNTLTIYEKSENNNKKIEPSAKLLDKIMHGWNDLEKVREIFGNQKEKGKVIFLDSFPVTPPKIKPDIMNPHYGDYYSGKTSPADYLNPVPIYFLTVEDTAFDFYLATKKRDSDIFNENIGGSTIIDWIKKVLCEHGIGAKTAVGYGYFNF